MLAVRLATHPRGWWAAARTGVQRWGDNPNSWGYAVRRLSPVQSRIGTAQLAGLDEINRTRRENGRRLTAVLESVEFVQALEAEPDAEPIFLRLPVLVDSAERRERLYRSLWTAGLGPGRMYGHALPEIFPQLDGPACPGAADVARRLLTLPTHHYVTQEDIIRIGNIFQGEGRSSTLPRS
jgi:dTDP-4-amino-4,6-dideoxygalactose transaminase